MPLGVIGSHTVTERSGEAVNEGPNNLVYIFYCEIYYVCIYHFLVTICFLWWKTNLIRETWWFYKVIILTLDRPKAASFHGEACRRIIFQPDTFSNNLYNIKVALLVSNQRQEGWKSMLGLSGTVTSLPITNNDNANLKMENERNYHLLAKTAFAWIWKCRREELVFAIMPRGGC